MGSPATEHMKMLCCLLSLLTLACPSAADYLEDPNLGSSLLPHYEHDHADAVGSSQDTRLQIFTVDYNNVQIPYEVTLWILLASLAKIGKWKWYFGSSLIGKNLKIYHVTKYLAYAFVPGTIFLFYPAKNRSLLR